MLPFSAHLLLILLGLHAPACRDPPLQAMDAAGSNVGNGNGSSQPDDPLDRHLLRVQLGEAGLTPPVVVPSDLQTALAALSMASVAPTPSSSRSHQPRVRPRRLPTDRSSGQPAGGGGRRAKRRRVPGIRDAAEDVFDPSPPPAGPEDIHEMDSGGATASEDEVDDGPRAAELIEYYKKRITHVLASSLDATQHSAESAGTLFRVVSVAGGAAVVLSEGERAYIVWARCEDGAVSYLCTCGGKNGAEAVQLRAWLGTSSSCCHARGLKASYAELAVADDLADDKALLERYPALDNASSPPAAECQVFYATKTSKKKGVFAVYLQSTWTTVVIRNKLNKQRTKKRVQRRPACTLISCAKDHWTCPHASSVATWCSELRRAMDAAVAMGGCLVDPFKDVLLPTVTVVPDAPQTVAALAAEWASFSDEARGRCSRNLLPCTGEVDDCHLFDQLADTGREAEYPAHLPVVLCEATCFSCGSAYNGGSGKNTGATLHTLRGRVTVTLRQWVCSCGEPVAYDGAHDGLFASSKETVFTRTFLDVMTQMVFTGHGTLSSAASVLCFLLESTKSLSGAPSSLARQTLIVAVHRYSRTLIVPATLYRCTKCKRAGDRPYIAVIADGQVLSILRNQSQPLVRLTQDVVCVAMDAGLGACLSSAAMRAAIRKRLTADKQVVARVTKDDHAALKRLSEELSSVPAPHAADAVTSLPANLSWASAFLFFSFYTNELSEVDPGEDEMAAAGSGADDEDGDAPPPAAAQGDGAVHGAAPAAHGEVGVEGAVVPPARGPFCASKQVAGAVGVGLSATAERERWRIVRRFLLTFLGHPVIGAFTGLPRKKIKRLAAKMALGAPVHEWKLQTTAVESVGIVWPFLRPVGMSDEIDPLMTRAIGEVLLFACLVDGYWETHWRSQASPASLAFEENWRDTSAAKYAAWAEPRTAPLPASSPLLCSKFSSTRGKAQLLEVLSGHVWPDLDPVRPFITDSKAEAVNDARAVKVKAGREALVEMLDKELGSDDCRHAFIASQTFMPGVENFLCPCGLLVGYDFLDRAESPAHVLASLMQRFPLLPSVVYFDTACQMARNASRRVPWLVHKSAMAASIDRAHRLQKQHGCSPVYDADAYPGRSVRHRTACAESRHSINKAFKTHLVHLRQDHFIVQLRLLGALVNLRVKMRHELGRETNHRRVCHFFYSHVQDYCDRRRCTCAHGRRQEAEATAAAADGEVFGVGDAAAANVAPSNGAPANPAAVNPAPDEGLPHEGPPPDAAADAAPADAADRLYGAVRGAVVAAVEPGVRAAVESAVPVVAVQVATAVGVQLGAAAGQAAVQAAFKAALDAGGQVGGDAVGLAAAHAAGESAAYAPIQVAITKEVEAAVRVAVTDASYASSAAPTVVSSSVAGEAAARAAAVAAVRAAGLVQPVAPTAVVDQGGQLLDAPVMGQAAVQVALRGALLAAGVVVKREPLPVTGQGGSTVQARDGCGSGVVGDRGGNMGVEEGDAAPPGVVVDYSSSDAVSSYSDATANTSGSEDG